MTRPVVIERKVAAELTELIESAGLPAALNEELQRLAVSRGSRPRVSAALEEIIDHLNTGLEQGRSSEDLLEQLGSTACIASALERGPQTLPSETTHQAALIGVVAGEARAAAASLLRSPLFAVGNILTLSLGFAAGISLFALLNGIVVRPLPFSEPGELFEVRELRDDGGKVFLSYPNFADIREQTDVFESVISTTWANSPVTVLGLEKAEQFTGLGISRDFFRTLGVQMIRGRDLSAEANTPGGAPEVVVSEEIWRSKLGAQEDLSALTLNMGAQVFDVVGVVPKSFRLFEKADLYVGHEPYPGTVRGAHAYQTLVRLAPNIAQEQAQQALEGLFARIVEQYPGEVDASSATLMPLRSQIVGSFRTAVIGLFGAAMLLMLLASLDVGASLVARTRKRIGEIAMRRSLGASRARLAFRQFSEASLIALPACLLGTFLAALTLRWAQAAGADELPRISEVRLDPSALSFAGLVAALALLVCSFVPMRHALSTSASVLLRESSAGGRRRRGGWSFLVAAEVAVAFLMLASAGLLTQSLSRVFAEDLGFEGRGLTAAYIQLPSSQYSPAQTVQFLGELEQQLASVPGVRSTGIANYLPLDWGSWVAPVVVPEDPNEWVAISGFRLVSSNYFELLNINVLAGTTLPESGMTDGSTAAVVNRSLARRLAGTQPLNSVLGKQVRNNMDPRSEWLTIVGVVEEARHWRAEPGAQTELFMHYATRPEALHSQIVLFETEGPVASAYAGFERSLSSLGPDVPARLVPLSEQMAQTLARERLATGALGAFALIMLVLTLVGIIGIVSRSVVERQREAGIRMALGATPRQVISILQREVLRPSVLGLACGIGLAILTTKVLASLLYGVEANDPSTFGVAAVALLGAAFLASLVPARSILKSEVFEAMRRN